MATSRARERRVAMHSPTGAAKAAVCITSGGAGTRRAQQGGGETREHDPPRGCPDRARPRHWAGSIWTAVPRLGTAAVPPDSPRGRENRVAASGQSRASAARASIAACTRALTTGLSGSASGCHCTPSTKRRSGSSIASGQLVEVGDAAHHQALAEPLHALVVVGLGHVGELPRGARRERPLDQHHVVLGAVEGAHHAAVIAVADEVGEVLDERAPEGDVDQLHPPADPEHRHVRLDRRPREGDLERVPLGHRVVGLRMGRLAVAGGVDVGSPGEHQAVDQLEHLVRLAHRVLVGDERQRQPARRAGPRRRSRSGPARPAGPRRSSGRARARRRCRSRASSCHKP